MTVVFVWIENASPRLAKAQALLEDSILAHGLRPLRFPAGQALCFFEEVLALGRREAGGNAFVWCNSDVILTRNPFDIPDPDRVYGFRRREVPSGRIVEGIDMYYLPVSVWDNDLSRDVPRLYVGASYVDWWISRAMQQYKSYENLIGYIDHPSHGKSFAANSDANPYYQKNFRAYNAWAKRHGLDPIAAPPYLIPKLGHVWGLRDALKRLRTRLAPQKA